MSKNSITCSLAVLFALVVSFILVSADLVPVSAQNSNSSTTQDEQTRGGMVTTQNTNTSATSSPRRRRNRRRGTRRTAAPSGDMAGDMGNANMTADTPATPQTGMTDAADGGAQTDLSGQSFTGTATYPDGNVSGAATLAFDSGNQFTLTPEGGTAMSGRYSAVTTRGYTGVTMMFSGATPPQIVSVRLKKVGNGVTIMSVPGESRQFSFTSTGGGGGMSKPRKPRKGKRRGPPKLGIKPPMDQQPTP